MAQANSFNSAVRLYNAPDWTDRVHLFNRDCAMYQRDPASTAVVSTSVPSFVIPEAIQQQMSAVIAWLSYGGVADLVTAGALAQPKPLTSRTVESSAPSDWVSSVKVVEYDSGSSGSTTPPKISCIAYDFARSTIPKEFATDQDGVGDYGERSFRSTLAAGQPFVTAGRSSTYRPRTVDGRARADSSFAAGDTMLVAYCDVYNDARTAILCRVRVFRIYGGDASQMTLVSPHTHKRDALYCSSGE